MGTIYGCIKKIIKYIILSYCLIAIFTLDIKKQARQDYNMSECTEEMVIVNECNIFKNENIRSKKLQKCKIGEKIYIDKYFNNKNWYKVYTLLGTGYINKSNVEYEENTFIDCENNLIIPLIPDGTILLDKGLSYTEENDSNLNYAYNYFELLPDSVKNKFKEDNWKIILTNEDLNKRYTDSVKNKIIGLTVPKEKVIYLSNKQKFIRKSLIHEVGHYVDISFDYLSKNDTFKTLYNNEKDKLKFIWETRHGDNYNEQEFFADVFKVCIDNDSIKEDIPSSVSYINAVLHLLELRTQ